MTEAVRRRDTFLLYTERAVRAFGAGYVAILLALDLPAFGRDRKL